MKIELKNFNHAAFASEETLCFSASVYVDDIRTFEVSNSGKGEENRIMPVKGKSMAAIHPVQEWVSQQPKVKLSDSMEVKDDLDFYLSRLANREVVKKQLKSTLKKHVLIFEPNDQMDLRQFASAFKPTDISDKHRQHLKRLYPGCVILNDLDIENALDLYIAASSQENSDVDKVYQRVKAA